LVLIQVTQARNWCKGKVTSGILPRIHFEVCTYMQNMVRLPTIICLQISRIAYPWPPFHILWLESHKFPHITGNFVFKTSNTELISVFRRWKLSCDTVWTNIIFNLIDGTVFGAYLHISLLLSLIDHNSQIDVNAFTGVAY
jgi:hypothetical protein